jgi:hypothetical protein
MAPKEASTTPFFKKGLLWVLEKKHLSSRALWDSNCIFNTCGLGGSDDDMGLSDACRYIDEARTQTRS